MRSSAHLSRAERAYNIKLQVTSYKYKLQVTSTSTFRIIKLQVKSTSYKYKLQVTSRHFNVVTSVEYHKSQNTSASLVACKLFSTGPRGPVKAFTYKSVFSSNLRELTNSLIRNGLYLIPEDP